jgi:hypothetical protein
MPNQETLKHEPCGNRATAKWAAVINGQLFPMPRRQLAARDILDQAGVGKEFVLVRDHGSPNDVVLDDHTMVDLAEGNVFRVIPRCEAGPQDRCTSPAKLAFVCDDAWRYRDRQANRTHLRLFGLPDDAELFSDFESPNDQVIGDDQVVLLQTVLYSPPAVRRRWSTTSRYASEAPRDRAGTQADRHRPRRKD